MNVYLFDFVCLKKKACIDLLTVYHTLYHDFYDQYTAATVLQHMNLLSNWFPLLVFSQPFGKGAMRECFRT